MRKIIDDLFAKLFPTAISDQGVKLFRITWDKDFVRRQNVIGNHPELRGGDWIQAE